MPREYEVFDRRVAPPATPQPVITLQRRGTWGINRAGFLALGEPSAVELLYSPEGEGAVGFRPASPDNPRNYPVRRQSGGSNFQTAGKAFCSTYDIEIPEYAKRFRGEMEDGILWADLGQDYQQESNGDEGRKMS